MGLQDVFLSFGNSLNPTVAALNMLVDIDRLGLAVFILAAPSSPC